MERKSPHARTYRPSKHYEETDTMRSEFSPHSSQARYSKSSGRRHVSRERPRVNESFDESEQYEDRPYRERSPQSRRRDDYYGYEESPRATSRRKSREGYHQRRAV
jgi:hypothetical protein